MQIQNAGCSPFYVLSFCILHSDFCIYDFLLQVPITFVMANMQMHIAASAATYGAPLTERRRRSRLPGETLGWLLPAQPRLSMLMPDEEQGWEVRVFNISRLGVGFISTEPLELGAEHRLRIGRGPMKRSRLIRIVACRQSESGTYAVGSEFVDSPARDLARAG
jgi:hypothetical protein